MKNHQKMTPDIKQWIDSASYEQLLEKWRTAPVGSPFFQDEAGKYYSKIMKEKREQVGDAAHTAASKSIG